MFTLGVFIDLFCAGGSLSLTTPRTQNDYPPEPQILPPRTGGVVHKISKVVKTERLPPRPGGSHSQIPMITTRDYPPDYPPTRGGSHRRNHNSSKFSPAALQNQCKFIIKLLYIV